jgi:hypothetical protein
MFGVQRRDRAIHIECGERVSKSDDRQAFLAVYLDLGMLTQVYEGVEQ